MVAVEQFVDPPDFVAVHYDFLPVLGFHHVTLLHDRCATKLVFHPHFAVLEDVHGRPILQFDRLCLTWALSTAYADTDVAAMAAIIKTFFNIF